MDEKPAIKELEHSIRNVKKERDQERHLLESILKIARMPDAGHQALCDQILLEILNMTKSKYAYYGFLNEDESVMTIYSWSREALEACKVRDKPIEYPIAGAGIWAEAVRQRKPIVVNDYAEDHPGKIGLPEGHVQLTRLFSVPIFSHGRIVAIAAGANKASAYVDEDIRQVEAFTTGVRALLDSQKAKEELQESEEKFRLLYENAPLAYQSLDKNGYFLAVNQAWLDTLGYSREEVIGRSFADFLHPDWRNHFNENFSRFKALGKTMDVEFEMVKKDGSTILVLFNGKIGRNERGGFKQTHCIFHDITARRQADEALAKSQAEFKAIFNSISDAAVFADTQRHIVMVNPAFTTIFGYKFEEVKGRNTAFLYETKEDYEKLGRRRYRVGIEPDHKPFEIRYQRKDGSLFWAESQGELVKDDQGNVIGFFAIHRDITERKQAEEELRVNEAELFAIYNNVPVILFLVDEERRVLKANRLAFESTGRHHDEIMGLRGGEALKCIHAADNPAGCGFGAHCEECIVRNTVLDSLKTGSTHHNVEAPVQIDFGDGVTDLCFLVSTFPLNVAGAKSILVCLENITERKQAEEALRKKEKELEQKAKNLEKANAALEVLLEHREEEKKKLAENIMANAKKLVLPYIDKIEGTMSVQENRLYLNIIKSNLTELISPFANTLSSKYYNFTPTEIQISDLIKQGKTSKEIASIFNISTKAVSFHRGNIRKKLGLTNEKVNLQSYLNNLF